MFSCRFFRYQSKTYRDVGMYHSGIGGGGFMIVRGSNGSYEFIDFRETAPAAAFQDMYNNNTNLSLFGGLARYNR